MSRATQNRSKASARLAAVAEAAYRDVAKLAPGAPGVPPIDAQFFAYAGMRSTVRLRDGRLYLRVSDLLEGASDRALGALARILMAKLLRRRVRKEWEEAYREHTAQRHVIEATEVARRERGRKELGAPAGQVYDLDALFDELDRRYFRGALGGARRRPRLGWTLRDGWRTHGHYDSAHHTIALSRTLDDGRVPRFVVEFVLFHEMLHVAIPSEVRDGKRYHHTPAFRKAEAQFPRFREAVTWLEKFDRPRGTRKRVVRSSSRR